MLQRLEALVAGALVASRWLMAPLYIGLIAALVIVIVEFFSELVLAATGFAALGSHGAILVVLRLVDLVLIANLVLIVISAGIGTLGVAASGAEHAGWTAFVGKIDFSGLKLKVVASLIAIAAVDLLEDFIEIGNASKSDVLWHIAILMAFVVSGVLLAWMDRLVAEPHD
jgi:uncharacterized protein (TIGR00645 family)